LSDQRPERAFISIGSNIDPERYLPLAIHRLKALGKLLAISSVYESPAQLPDAHPLEGEMPNFLNVAALLETTLEPADLKQALRSIEEDLGRVRLKDKYAARAIDLDLSLYGSQMVDDPQFPWPSSIRHLCILAKRKSSKRLRAGCGEWLSLGNEPI
jgi:2-amino-4-hydroxy-6-hydroxymethyldihydropteridine diphosphokinase